MTIYFTEKKVNCKIYIIIIKFTKNIINDLKKYGFDLSNQKFFLEDIKKTMFTKIYQNDSKLILIDSENKNIYEFLKKNEFHNELNQSKIHLITYTNNLETLVNYIESILLGNYKFDKYLSRKQFRFKDLYVCLNKITSEKKKYLDNSIKLFESVSMVRDLGNEPANIMNPDNLSNFIKNLGAKNNFNVTELKINELKKLNMNSLISVSQGSKYSARLLIVNKNNKFKTKPIVLVGKGVTFDTGGISLKGPKNMYDMKGDMIGLSTVLGVINTLVNTNTNVNVIGVLPIVENMISMNATRPGDVVKSMSGKTIEIRNTDAEGRLIMADAITYSMKFDPKLIIDVATLTGMQSSMSCGYYSTIMGNDQRIIDNMLKIGEKVNERLWPMPIYDEFKELTKSKIADIKNDEFGDCRSSTTLAGAFLSHFVEDKKWIHLDIAGTGYIDNNIYNGSTGIGVKLLVTFLKNSLNK